MNGFVRLSVGLKHRIARSSGQHLTYYQVSCLLESVHLLSVDLIVRLHMLS